MKKIFLTLFCLMFVIFISKPAAASSSSLQADAHCDKPWFYKFNFSGQDVSIEHCGRSDNGSLDYTVTSQSAGELLVYYEASETTIRLKVNGRSHSQKVSGKNVWRTGITVVVGDKISLLADMGDSPYSGWTSPKNQLCNGFFGAGSSDVSGLYAAIQGDGNKLISAQCWGDGYAHENLLKEKRNKPNVTLSCDGSAKDCHDVLIEDMDFNDGAFFLAVDERIPHLSTCEDLRITRGNNSRVPAKLSFSAKASDNLGQIKAYRFIFGDGSTIETTHAEVDHTYETSGKFEVIVEAKDSKDNWLKSEDCQVVARVAPAAIESHKSACSYLYIPEGQNRQAPALVKFKVAGYDNKGDLKAYRIDYGDGNQVESSSNLFEHQYAKPGTYKVKAEIKDSTDQWQRDGKCEQTVYVSTEPLQEQPSTGTPTWMSVIGLVGGALAFAYPFAVGTKNMNKSSFKKGKR